ncbi:hypothetical protein RB620_24550 [Paenibacillus sp. LHD-117]|uniref:hypothetical protein n=1 Tax=Paenibacillus sp. LHD-117 TaxID=3071412 RepID=UPI0027E10DD0|nr:hypothetical protein [Paenibacillus sp. LHD-117]MDQ6422607.1 hypothetical protein [Paenibacillus sp. LHD-117]
MRGHRAGDRGAAAVGRIRICGSRLPRPFPVCGGAAGDRRAAAAASAGSGSAGRGRRGRSWCVVSAPAIEEHLLRRANLYLQVEAAVGVPGAWPT